MPHLSPERSGNPDDYLAHVLFVNEPAQVGRKIPAWHDLKRAGYYTFGIGDRDTCTHVPHVQGSNAPAIGVPQDLLPGGEALV